MEQSASHDIAPVEKLYRHTLESIFKFCTLQELHAVLAVNRDWSSAVMSMPPLRVMATAASIDHLSLIAASRLSRHVNELWGACTSSLGGLQILAERMPSIDTYTFLWDAERGACAEEAQTLSRLRTLATLSLQLHSGADDLTAEVLDQSLAVTKSFLEAAGQLPQLESLTLDAAHDGRISFTPLSTVRLREIQYCGSDPLSAIPSQQQVATLRAMHSIERFEHNFTDRNGTLRLLLQAPTPPLRWQSTQVSSAASDLLPLLHSLTDLTELDVEPQCADVGFLCSLPHISTLRLCAWQHELSAADLSQILSTLQRCTQITRLTLDSLAFTTAQLSELLPSLPQLCELKLLNLCELTSLSFLATEELASSLAHLVLGNCPQTPSSEIVHLLGLRSLRRLIVRGFQDSISDEQWDQLRSVCPSADD